MSEVKKQTSFPVDMLEDNMGDAKLSIGAGGPEEVASPTIRRSVKGEQNLEVIRKSNAKENMRRSRETHGPNHAHESKHDDTPKGTFVDAAAMKEKVREKLSKPKYDVADFYHDTGCSQRIARSGLFDKMTLSVISFNAIWIAIDTDMNTSPVLSEADPPFIIAENFFCIYFSFEWLVRFVSFRRKLDGVKDAWFCFDTFMVTMMVLETWLFTILVMLMGGAQQGGNTGILRMARLLRLSRMARMGKLLRVMPELMIMVKGMKAATRSVFFTLVLLTVIMYVYAIAMVQLSGGTDVGSTHFPGVPASMYTLLVFGIFLDNIGILTDSLGEADWVLPIVFFTFVLLGALTVMNMLIGVLCEVVSAVAQTEQEEMLVNYVNEKISRVMAILDTDGGGSISKKEFTQILDNVEAVRCLNDVGVDVFALIDLADYIFEDDDTENNEEIELDFCRFMEVVLQLRGTNQATVKDIVDLRKFMRLSMQEHYQQTKLILEKLSEGAKMSEQMFSQMGPGTSTAATSDFFQQPCDSQCGFRATSDMSSDHVGYCCRRCLDNPGEHGPNCEKKMPSAAVNGSSHFNSHNYEERDSFDAGAYNEMNARVPPSAPRVTPSGQLLSWVPILSPDFLPPAALVSENLALNGTWSHLAGNGLEHHELRIPTEAETPASNLAVSGVRNSAKEACDNGKPTKWVGAEPDMLMRIPRLHVASGGAADREINALQSHFENICSDMAMQLAAGLNDAIELAGRSSSREYSTKLHLGPDSGLNRGLQNL